MMDGYGMDGWDWLWMLPMMIVWIVVLAAVVYLAVKFALRGEHHTTEKP